MSLVDQMLHISLIAFRLRQLERMTVTRRVSRAGEMIPDVEGTRPRGPRGKGSPSVSKGPNPVVQLLQLLKNSPKEVKRAHFRYISGPPGPTQEMEFMGPGGEGPSQPPPPGFSGHASKAKKSQRCLRRSELTIEELCPGKYCPYHVISSPTVLSVCAPESGEVHSMAARGCRPAGEVFRDSGAAQTASLVVTAGKQ